MMEVKSLLTSFSVFFGLTFIVATVVNLLWNVVFHKTATVEWGTPFVLAMTFGIVFPLVIGLKGKKTEKS